MAANNMRAVFEGEIRVHSLPASKSGVMKRDTIDGE